jgi:5-hydroxyisourate hydrolase-like protein (transthyretin family)
VAHETAELSDRTRRPSTNDHEAVLGEDTNMNHKKLVAALASAALTAGALLAMASSADATTPPYEPDSGSVGTITFYNAAGTAITGGSINDKPFAAYAVGSATVHAGDTNAVMRFAQPNPNATTQLWSKDDISAFTSYPLSTGPANIVSLSQTHPVNTGANTDLSINDFVGEFPNTDTTGTGCAYAATPAGCTNTAYQNLYQIRLVTANGAVQASQYDVADILVTGTTWTQVYGGAPVQDNSSLTISGPNSVNYKASAKLSTVLKDTTTNQPISGANVTLKRRAAANKPWTTVGTVMTSATGAASKSLALTANTQFEWTYASTATHKAATSPVKSVSVAQVVAIHSTKTTIAHGVAFKIWGTVNPPSSGQKVTLQHLVGTAWKNVGTATQTKQKLPNGQTTVGYVLTVKESAKGTYKFRVEKAATATLAKGDSPIVTVKVT